MANHRNDQSPWLARPDWAQGRIVSSARSALVLPWIMAGGAWVVTGAYLLGTGLLLHPVATIQREPGLLVLLLFVAVASGLLLAVLRQTWRAVRSSGAVFEMASVPGVIGRTLEGRIRLRRSVCEGQAVRLVLRCIQVSTRASARRSTMSNAALWEDDREVNASQASDTGGSSVIPVRFAIPASCQETLDREDTPDGWRSISWVLSAETVPSGSWEALFQVPVFKADPAIALEETPRVPVAERSDVRPPSSRIVVEDGIDLTFHYPLRAGFVLATLWVVLTLPLYALPTLSTLAGLQAYVPFGTTGALVAGLLLNAVPAFLLVIGEPRRIVVRSDQVVVVCGWPLVGITRRFPLSEFDGVFIDPHFLALQRRSGSFFRRQFFLATKLSSKAEARWLGGEIDRAIRRRLGPAAVARPAAP
jgi:hypothetical protein